ncbi:hypothetical protein Brms1b_012802 [Colletotrichum noveboracense]|nr:hypothetical protein Brms1b_012802 [Colletotrichum noveboracense]
MFTLQLTRHVPAADSDVVEMNRVLLPSEKIIVVLGINIWQPIRPGESYYFIVDGVPVRVAWVRRHAKLDSTAHYKAILFVSTTPDILRFEEVRGPFVLPTAPAMKADRTLDILATDSGIVEAYQCFAWRRLVKHKQPASSLTWVNESPEMLQAWLTYAGINYDEYNGQPTVRVICTGKSREHLVNIEFSRWADAKCKHDEPFIARLKQFREARVILCAEDGDSLRNVMQDYMPLGHDSPYSK